MPQTSGRWRALPQHPVTGCGNFSGRSRESRRQLDHKTLRAATTRPIFQAYFGQSGRNSGNRQQDPIMALEAVSQDGSARRRNARLSVPAQGGGTGGRSQAPARGLLGSLAGFGKAGPALSAQTTLAQHSPDRLHGRRHHDIRLRTGQAQRRCKTQNIAFGHGPRNHLALRQKSRRDLRANFL